MVRNICFRVFGAIFRLKMATDHFVLKKYFFAVSSLSGHMCRFCLKHHYIPPIFVLNHYFLPKNDNFYTLWAVGSLEAKKNFVIRALTKKCEKSQNAEGQKTPGPFTLGVALRRGSYTTLGLRWVRISSSGNERFS